MARELGQLYVGIDCSNCGVHGEGGLFGSEATEYCAEHDVHYEGLYPEDNHCPMCREEQRDPQVEPW